ncbi:hypothetical protein H5410_029843 [Solanum commersonii]|uniref:Uncharacterized protein n=1 Tax=Solanum commersonii TaxID=4109 RepID=A0A9J5YDW5_SOLCO|nr:hypothetical protein H5410_029843 [Solanum commersonii]
MSRILLKERGAFGNADTGGAWLSSDEWEMALDLPLRRKELRQILGGKIRELLVARGERPTKIGYVWTEVISRVDGPTFKQSITLSIGDFETVEGSKKDLTAFFPGKDQPWEREGTVRRNGTTGESSLPKCELQTHLSHIDQGFLSATSGPPVTSLATELGVHRHIETLFRKRFGALRLSAQTRGDRPCQYMDLASPPWVMNSRCIFEEYHAPELDTPARITGDSYKNDGEVNRGFGGEAASAAGGAGSTHCSWSTWSPGRLEKLEGILLTLAGFLGKFSAYAVSSIAYVMVKFRDAYPKVSGFIRDHPRGHQDLVVDLSPGKFNIACNSIREILA